MKLEIREQGICCGQTEYRYPWKDMEIGDYFLSPRTQSCLQSAGYAWAKRNHPERKFKVAQFNKSLVVVTRSKDRTQPKETNITQEEMFEKSFQRPKDFCKLSLPRRWEIDKKLGILDWRGENLSEENRKRIKNHYD